MKQATLTITVDYDDNPDSATIEALLRDVARLAAGNGMLSGDGEITVESWDAAVTIGDDPVRTALTDLVDSYDDTGCEDCGVVDEAAYEAGRKALGLVDETEAAPTPTDDTVRGVWARFRPQAYINDNAVDIDGGFMFDVTMQIEKMGQDKALKIEDHNYGADNLWHAYVEGRPEKEHDGPFEIEVEGEIRKFYGLDD